MSKADLIKLEKDKALNKLTGKQKLFAVEYLKDFNGTKAYQRAGYKCNENTARINASKLLTNTNIQDAINELIDEILGDRKEVSLKVINELKTIAFSDIGDYLEYDENGIVKIVPSNKVNTKPILKIKQTKTTKSTKDGDTIETSQFDFSMNDKIKALELLAKYANLFNDKPEINIENNGGITIVAAKGTEDW